MQRKTTLNGFWNSSDSVVFCLVDLWCLMPPSTIFQLYRGSQFYIGGGNRRTRRKPPTCHNSLTLSQNVVLLALSGNRTHNVSDDRHRLHR